MLDKVTVNLGINSLEQDIKDKEKELSELKQKLEC